MPRVVRRLLTGLSFVAFGVGAAVLSWIRIPRFRRRTRALPPAERERARRAFLVDNYGWTVGFMAARGLIEIVENGPPDGLPEGPYVLIANHPSLIDVLVLKSRIPGITCVVRADLWRRRWLRPLLDFGRDIRGPDRDRTRVGDTTVLDAFIQRLQGGDPVLVFPEGSRSPVDGLRRFRRGALEAAIRVGVPVVPAVLEVSPPTLKHGDPWWRVPDRKVRISLSYLPTVPVGPHDDSAALARTLRRDYARALGLSSEHQPALQARPGESSMR